MKTSPKLSCHIRPARAADLANLLVLENLSFTGERLNERRMRHWINASNGILLVANATASPGQLLGYCLAFTRKNSTVVRAYSLAIAPKARGMGLGGKLLERAAKKGKQQGCTHIRLEVAKGNISAIALYKKLHYVSFASIPDYYEDGQDAWRMHKVL